MKLTARRVQRTTYDLVSISLFLLLLLPLLLPVCSKALASENPDHAAFEKAVSALEEKSYKKKREAIETIAQMNHPQSLSLLQALLEGDIHGQRQSAAAEQKAFVIAQGMANDEVTLTNAMNGAAREPLSKAA